MSMFTVLKSSVLLCILVLVGCKNEPNAVVAYVSLDRHLSEPILLEFEKQSGIDVLSVYDTEANKTTGLVNRLIAEAKRPRADLFWNNEVAQLVRLSDAGILAEWTLPREDDLVAGMANNPLWTGFAARIRVFVVHTPENADLNARDIDSLEDLVDPRWKGKAAIANPHFGTTGTHFAALLSVWGEEKFKQWLRALKENEVAVLPGNAQVKNAVSAGQYRFGLTDTDDANEALQEGKKISLVFPDQLDTQLGAFMIPNAIALVKGRPQSEKTAQLAKFLTSAKVEESLAQGSGAQIPLRHAVPGPKILPDPSNIRLMKVDYSEVGRVYSRMLAIVDQEWSL